MTTPGYAVGAPRGQSSFARPVAPTGPRQPQVLAQRRARVVPVEESAALELGYDEAREILVGARHVGGRTDEAVRGSAREPLLEPVRHLGGTPHEARHLAERAATAVLDEVAHGRVRLAAQADDAVPRGLEPAESGE